MSETEFDDVLKTRAGSRPDSFYQKLLRKLKLAKKTDMSSGVAVIDITDDDNDGPVPSKRKCFQLDEIQESGEPDCGSTSTKRQCLYEDVETNGRVTAPLSHFPENFANDKLSHYPTSLHINGKTSGEPIVIDDDESDEEILEEMEKDERGSEEPPETVNISDSFDALNDNSNPKNESTSINEIESESNNLEDIKENKNDTSKDTRNTTSNKIDPIDNITDTTVSPDGKEDSNKSTSIPQTVLTDHTNGDITSKNTVTVDDTCNKMKNEETEDKTLSAEKCKVEEDKSALQENEDNCKTETDKLTSAEELDTASKSCSSNLIPTALENPIEPPKETVPITTKKVIDDVEENIVEGDLIEEDKNDGDSDCDDDDDEIEIVSEDVGCVFTYGKYFNAILFKWKYFVP